MTFHPRRAKKLQKINEELDRLGLLNTFSDPYYMAFPKGLSRRRGAMKLFQQPTYPKEEIEEQEALVDDTAHALTKAGLAAIPIVGSSAAELFALVLAPPINRRQQEGMEAIAEGLRRFEEQQKCFLEDLRNNDAFIDTVMQASQGAIRTANEEKREAPKNAVLTAAFPNRLDESKQQVFVNLVDQFTVWHLRILHLFADPNAWFAANGIQPPRHSIAGSLSQTLTTAFPELQDQRDLYDIVGRDLFHRGLFGTDGFHAMLRGEGRTNDSAR